MKKRYLGVLTSLALAISLAGCTLPGERTQDDDDYIPSNSSEDDSEPVEEVVNYEWVIEPSVSAENIIVFDGSQVDPDSYSLNSMFENVAVICKNGLYGFINYSGEIVVEPSYKYYYICSCGQIILYNVTDTENDVREYCTLDDEGSVVDYFTTHESSKVKYYYNEEDGKIYYAREADNWTVYEYTDKKTVVAMKADIVEVSGEYDVIEPDEGTEKYGLVKQDEVVLDFDYDDYYAPAYKGIGITAIALEKDGKWGYVNSSGEEIVSFNCDEIFSSYNGEFSDSEDESHPYLYSEDFLAVSINYSFGYYNMDGKCLVKSSEFEQARPVHHNKAWVCSGGLWGVIRFGEEDDEEEEVTTTTTTTTTSATTTTSGYWSSTTSSAASTTTEAESLNAWTTKDTKKTTTAGYTDPVYTDTDPVYTEQQTTQQTYAPETEAPVVVTDPPVETDPVYVDPTPTDPDNGAEEY